MGRGRHTRRWKAGARSGARVCRARVCRAGCGDMGWGGGVPRMGVSPLPPGPSRDLQSPSSPSASPPHPPFLPASDFLGVPVGGSPPVHPALVQRLNPDLPALHCAPHGSAPSLPPSPWPSSSKQRWGGRETPPPVHLPWPHPSRPGLGLRHLPAGSWPCRARRGLGTAGTSEGRGPGLERGVRALRAGGHSLAHEADGWVGVWASGRSVLLRALFAAGLPLAQIPSSGAR